MIHKLKSIGLMAAGAGILIGALVGQVLWLGFCFGTVIVGVFLLFAMPMVLVWPVAAGIPTGLMILASGWAMWQLDSVPNRSSIYDVDAFELEEDAKIAEAKRIALASIDRQNKAID